MSGRIDLHHLVEVPESGLRRIDARIKLAVAASLIVSLAWAPMGMLEPYGRLGALLVVLAVVGQVPLRAWLVRLLPLAPFLVTALFIPFLHAGSPETGTPLSTLPFLPPMTREGLARATGVLARMLTLGGAMALLSASTPFHELLDGLRAFRAPARLVQSLELMFRYLFLLLEEGQRMSRAHAARGGDWRPGSLQRQSLGAVVGALFARSYQRGERVQQAMLARGLDVEAAPVSRAYPPVEQLVGGGVLVLTVFALRFVGVAHG